MATFRDNYELTLIPPGPNKEWQYTAKAAGFVAVLGEREAAADNNALFFDIMRQETVGMGTNLHLKDATEFQKRYGNESLARAYDFIRAQKVIIETAYTDAATDAQERETQAKSSVRKAQTKRESAALDKAHEWRIDHPVEPLTMHPLRKAAALHTASHAAATASSGFGHAHTATAMPTSAVGVSSSGPIIEFVIGTTAAMPTSTTISMATTKVSMVKISASGGGGDDYEPYSDPPLDYPGPPVSPPPPSPPPPLEVILDSAGSRFRPVVSVRYTTSEAAGIGVEPDEEDEDLLSVVAAAAMIDPGPPTVQDDDRIQRRSRAWPLVAVPFAAAAAAAAEEEAQSWAQAQQAVLDATAAEEAELQVANSNIAAMEIAFPPTVRDADTDVVFRSTWKGKEAANPIVERRLWGEEEESGQTYWLGDEAYAAFVAEEEAAAFATESPAKGPKMLDMAVIGATITTLQDHRVESENADAFTAVHADTDATPTTNAIAEAEAAAEVEVAAVAVAAAAAAEVEVEVAAAPQPMADLPETDKRSNGPHFGMLVYEDLIAVAAEPTAATVDAAPTAATTDATPMEMVVAETPAPPPQVAEEPVQALAEVVAEPLTLQQFAVPFSQESQDNPEEAPPKRHKPDARSRPVRKHGAGGSSRGSQQSREQESVTVSGSGTGTGFGFEMDATASVGGAGPESSSGATQVAGKRHRVRGSAAIIPRPGNVVELSTPLVGRDSVRGAQSGAYLTRRQDFPASRKITASDVLVASNSL